MASLGNPGGQGPRVWVTGLGFCVPGGTDQDSLFEGLSHPDSSPRARGCPVPFAEFDPKSVVQKRKALKVMGANTQYALKSALEAWSDCGREPADADASQTGIVLGARSRPTDFSELLAVAQKSRGEDGQLDFSLLGTEGASAIFPLSMLKALPNLVTAQVSIRLGLHGTSDSLTSGEVSGIQAILEAYRILYRQDEVRMLAGGTEDLSDPVSRSLDRLERNVEAHPTSSGSATLVLEAGDFEGRSYAEVLAVGERFGASSDPSVDTALVQELLVAAGLAPEAIDVVAVDLDSLEGRGAAPDLFSKLKAELPGASWVSLSRWIGHSGCASASLEAALAASLLKQGTLPEALCLEGDTSQSLEHALVLCRDPEGNRAGLVLKKGGRA